MLLTTKGRYAVMAIVDMAQNKSNKPRKILDISREQNISINYLEQIFNRLKNANIVTSVRGPGGGYVLCKDPQDIFIVEIVRAVEEPIKFTQCSHDNKPCKHSKNIKCQTHILWKGLENNISKYLEKISIDDICQGRIAA